MIIGKELRQWVFTGYFWGQYFAITWCEIHTIKRIHMSLPNKLSELLRSDYEVVLSSIVLPKHNSSHGGQTRALLGDCLVQTAHLLTVQIRIRSLAGEEQPKVDKCLPIPPKSQENLPISQSWFGDRFCSLTTNVLILTLLWWVSHFSSSVMFSFRNVDFKNK